MITILIGTSLVGKSSWVKTQNRFIISSDSERESLFGTYRQGEKFEEKLIQECMEAKLRILKDVIIDNTNLKLSYIDNWIEIANELNEPFEIIVFPLLEKEELIKRNQKRFIEIGKLIPEKVIINQIKNYNILLEELENKDYYDKVQKYLS